MKVVAMIDNTALDNTATDTAGGDKDYINTMHRVDELTFSRELS